MPSKLGISLNIGAVEGLSIHKLELGKTSLDCIIFNAFVILKTI